ncbi:hypothetical protein CIB84_006761, partial [Bambusicola thoracicus]
SAPSSRELEELELLNAALEKALRVRKSVSRAPAAARGAPGAKPAGGESDGGDTGELQLPAATRDGPAAACHTCDVRAAKKPPPYRLRAPYRTDPDMPAGAAPSLQESPRQELQTIPLFKETVESQRRLHPDCTGDQRDCCAAGARVCGSAGTLAVPLLCYSRLRELRDLFALKLRVSMLHQQIALQKVGL